jgi:hypothetical protein
MDSMVGIRANHKYAAASQGGQETHNHQHIRKSHVLFHAVLHK